MNFKNFILILFSFLNIYNVHSQYIEYEILRKINSYELEKATDLVNKSRLDKSLKNVFLFEILYLKKGKVDSTLIKEVLPNTTEESIIENYAIAQYYSLNNSKDSLVYVYLKRAFENAKKNKDTLLMNISLRKILFLYLKNGETYKEFRSYVKTAYKIQKDKSDAFLTIYYDIASNLQKWDTVNFSQARRTKTEHKFKEGIKLANHPYEKGKLYNMMAIYNEVFLSDTLTAKKYYDKAYHNYTKIKEYYGQSQISSIRFNKLVENEFQKRNYKKVIEAVKEDIEIKEALIFPEKKVYLMHNYKYLYQCYEQLEEYDISIQYLKRMHKTKDLLDAKKYAKDIFEINTKYNLEEVKKELESLKKQNRSLSSNLKTIIPALGFISIVLIVIFYLYKRYKKKSIVLEEEQSETLQKLDELKQIVIKNHIVLKDKTKVYISDLMYIQSDDHYLKIFTQDGKNRFVRGKLSQLKEELPPNFIQCHRSYIVNRNFIKQIHSKTIVLIHKEEIPLSRTYKNKF